MTGTTATSRLPLAALLAGLLVAGCTDNKWGSDSGLGQDDDDGTITLGDGGSGDEDCGDTPPVIEGGPYCEYYTDIPEGGTEEVPMMRISSYTTDVDGDLHYRAVRLWFDGEPLGEIDTETAEFKEKDRTQATDRPCNTFDGTPNDKWILYEGRVEWEAMYDWGMAVQDAAGNWSDMAITQCPAPTAEGKKP